MQKFISKGRTRQQDRELFVFRFEIGLFNNVHIELVPNRFGNQLTAPITAGKQRKRKGKRGRKRERKLRNPFTL